MESSDGRLDSILNLFRGFKWVWMAIALLSSISLFIHVFLWPDSIDLLSLSASKPWGIVTGAFVHKNWSHLHGNLIVFVLFCIYFIIGNMLRDIESKEFSSKVFFVSSFLAGTIVAGPLELWARDFVPNVFGASGIAYASAGPYSLQF